MSDCRKVPHNTTIFFFIAVAVVCGSLAVSAGICRAAEADFTARELADQTLKASGEGITDDTLAAYRNLLSLGDDFESRKIQAEIAWKLLYRAGNVDQLKRAEIIYRAARKLGDEEDIRISQSRASKAIMCAYILAKRPDDAADVLHSMEKLGAGPEVRAQRAEAIATFMRYTVTNGGAAATLPWYKAVNTLGTEPAEVVRARLQAAKLMQLAWTFESNAKGVGQVYYDMEAIGSDLNIRLRRMDAAGIAVLSYASSENPEKAMSVYESTGLLGEEPEIRQQRERIKKSMEYMKQMMKGVPSQE